MQASVKHDLRLKLPMFLQGLDISSLDFGEVSSIKFISQNILKA